MTEAGPLDLAGRPLVPPAPNPKSEQTMPMTLREKLKAWVASKKITQAQIAQAASMAPGSVSQFLGKDFELSDIGKVVGIAAKLKEQFPGASIDWLLDDTADWPPPSPDNRVQLTEPEARVLRIIRDAYSDDQPELKVVIARLTGRDHFPSRNVRSRNADDDATEREAEERTLDRPRHRKTNGNSA